MKNGIRNNEDAYMKQHPYGHREDVAANMRDKKVSVKWFLCIIKHHVMKTYGGVDV
jgi:hypothetical protein